MIDASGLSVSLIPTWGWHGGISLGLDWEITMPDSAGMNLTAEWSRTPTKEGKGGMLLLVPTELLREHAQNCTVREILKTFQYVFSSSSVLLQL